MYLHEAFKLSNKVKIGDCPAVWEKFDDIPGEFAISNKWEPVVEKVTLAEAVKRWKKFKREDGKNIYTKIENGPICGLVNDTLVAACFSEDDFIQARWIEAK